MAVTKNYLHTRVYMLNEMLRRPVTQFASKPGEPVVFNVGHIFLDHNVNGYSLEEQTSPNGGVNVLCRRLSSKEMCCMLAGMTKGIGLLVDSIATGIDDITTTHIRSCHGAAR
jgi:hypothetical protein